VLRPREIGRGLVQDLIGLAQFADLALQRLDPVALDLPDPLAQYLGRAADLGCD